MKDAEEKTSVEVSIELLEYAEDVIGRLHSLLPDDGAPGSAPSWWQLGTEANGVRAQIRNLLREASRE